MATTERAHTREPVVWMKDIEKVYPDGTVALRGAELELYPGEVVGLLGENGAGKTTLMKILSGLLRPTRGEILVNGRPQHFNNPVDALRVGIGMVHQTFALVPPYTALENILLGQEAARSLARLSKEQAREKVKALIEDTGLDIPLDVPVEQLPIGVQQRVEILKTLYRGTNVLILDEPTSALTPVEVDELFRFLERLEASGKSIVFITHKLKEVLEICGRIVVLRQGQVTGKIASALATPEKLAEMMVGRKVVPRVVRSAHPAGAPVLTVQNLRVTNDAGTPVVKDLSFEVRSGEIFGIAGVEGNGQSELVQAITGLRKAQSGQVILKGTPVTNQNPLRIYQLGLGHIPEDKNRFGLALQFDVAENAVLSRQRDPQFVGLLDRLNWNKIRNFARELIERFNIIAPGLTAKVRSLSGGNQQRLLVGREISKEPSVIVAMHPTRGLDVASTVYIREELVELRDEGKGVLLVSADLDEIMELSDRVAVMYEGAFIGQGSADELSRETIGLMMGGVVPNSSAPTQRRSE